DTFTLDYAVGVNGSLTGDPAQVVNYGADGTAVTAVPDLGYHFVDWSDASTDNPRTDVSVVANLSVTANFAIDTHTVTFIEGANGTITGTLVQVIDYGDDCTAVTPVANANHHFVDWTGDYAGTDDPLTITNVTADMVITANFAIDTYTVTFIEGANGTITGTLVQTIDHGNDCTAVDPVANANHNFVDWTGDYAGTDDPLTITNVTADMNITANFAIDTFTLDY
ncbi:unnamed protein product, partial [marine sediment metagenome]